MRIYPSLFFSTALLLSFSPLAAGASAPVNPSSSNATSAPVTPDIQNLDCRADMAQINQDLASNPSWKDRLELLILKARLLRDDRSSKSARKEGLKTVDEGLRSARKAEVENPGQSWPWTMEGMLDLLKTQYLHFPKGMRYGKMASRANSQALALSPDDPEANLSRGLEDYYKPWFVGGSYVKAQKRFRKALEKQPKNPRILSWNGLADLALDRDNRGFQELKEAADICPDNPIYKKRLLTRRPR